MANFDHMIYLSLLIQNYDVHAATASSGSIRSHRICGGKHWGISIRLGDDAIADEQVQTQAER